MSTASITISIVFLAFVRVAFPIILFVLIGTLLDRDNALLAQ